MLQFERQALEFKFRLRMASERLSALEREVGVDLTVDAGRVIATESVDRMFVLLDLVNRDLTGVGHELEFCRTLNEQILKSLREVTPADSASLE